MLPIDESQRIPIATFSDKEIAEFLKKNQLALTVEEVKLIQKKLGRDPTLTELHVFNIEWSEHCSYRSSRSILKKYLPTEGPTVILGPGEDSGILFFTEFQGEKYGIVISHESHNHPSQVVPYEGAATGIGGIVRDVVCMGAKVIATADPLRFGNPYGKNKNKVRYIANEVINGIAGYGNPLGIPNLAGDVYFNDSFDENCLVNVVCLGLVKEKNIIHSAAPGNAEGYDIILVGKATDNSGFGGAAFASVVLDEEQEEWNKGAVQVPDPFLKNVILRASYQIFQEVAAKKVSIGFKDLGAGGVMCAASELCAAGNQGCIVDLDKVHVSMKNLPPYVVACGETQERLCWISPSSFTPRILEIYNQEFELPKIAEGARATVIGRVTKEKDFILRYHGKIVCHAPIEEVTGGIRYERLAKERKEVFAEPDLAEPRDYNAMLLSVLEHPNVCNRSKIYEHYDREVMGNAIIRSGEADAGLMTPIPNCPAAVALKVDCNPKYTRINPYWGSVAAVAESMRNVAAIGAMPIGLTDCLNFGNPEIPEQFWLFVECVRGIGDAAKNLYWKGTKLPVPFVSGNVSFYNQSASGRAIDPSPVIACVGVMQDYSKAITMQVRKAGSVLCLLGERKDEMGGSVYYDLHRETGKNIPKIGFEQERNRMYVILDMIDARLLLSCHDISDGGLAVTIAEMLMGGNGKGRIGAEMQLNDALPTSKLLFSESPGFVFEIAAENLKKAEAICSKYGIDLFRIGETLAQEKLRVYHNEETVLDLPLEELKQAWMHGMEEALE